VTPAALAALHAACFVTPRPWSEQEMAEVVATPHGFLLLEEGGFLIGRVIADEAELLTLAVAPALRRRGTARALVARFAAAAAERGATTAFLEVSEDNTAARALYAALGWQDAGRRRDYYVGPDGKRCDALVLRLAIDATKALGCQTDSR
jgi:ribosomal-protein-alanine N-acetyltransferase